MSFVMNLANWTERFSTPTERFFLGVTMTLVGLTIVLLVLSLISVMVSAISRVIRSKTNKSTVHFEGHAPVASAATLSTPAKDLTGIPIVSSDTTPATVPESADLMTDATLVALFAAAISAFTASSEPQTTAGFVIRRFRRV